MQFRSSQNTITKARKVAATSILIVYLVRFNEAEEYSGEIVNIVFYGVRAVQTLVFTLI